jgi:drug/metabolite transporter (DMT)-like permease
VAEVPPPGPGRGRLFATAEGSRPDPFGPTEWGLLAAVSLIWGSSYLWIELALRGLDPGVVALGRTSLGFLTIALVPASRRPIAREDRARVVALGLGWVAPPMLLFPIAQALGTPTALVGMLNGAMPLFATLVAAVLLRRAPGRPQVAGVVLGFAGLLTIALPRVTAGGGAAVGVLLIVGSMTVNAVFASVIVPLQQRYGALPMLRWAMGTGLVAALPTGLRGLTRSVPDPVSLAAMVPLGVVSTGLGFVLWATLVGRAGATRGSIVSYLVPLVAILLGVVVLGERVSGTEVLGMALVLAGAGFVSRREPRRRTAGAGAATLTLRPGDG